MAQDIYQLANLGVQALSPYAPGKPMDELAREIGLDISKIIKLASNENPLGCSEEVKAVVRQAGESLTLYPDGNGFALKEALIKHLKSQGHSFTHKNLILGNGSNDILELIARAFLNERSEAIFSEYAFAVYPIAVQAVSASAKVSPALNWGHDLDAMLNLVSKKTKVIFIANPNNPTGTWLTKDQVTNFLDAVSKNIIVVLDEAYFEYVTEDAYPNGIELLKIYKNLIVTRTFSKAYGIAGLRVGYGIACEEVIDILNRVRQPFNVNSLAMAGATAALQDQQFIKKSVECNSEGLQFLYSALDKLGISYIKSVANFLSINLESADKANAANQFLLNNGLIVRSIAVYNMPSYLRVTIGNQQQNELFINLLTQFLEK
jgi:histidinol-phosphate aminotransferase